jgi:hypothetical protein
MISRPRWRAERRLMANVFPQFQPFVRGGICGFRGRLFGRRRLSGRRVYAVEIRAHTASYPEVTPYIFITPRVGPNWLTNGALCVTQPWKPGRSTFAQIVLYAAAYLQEKG